MYFEVLRQTLLKTNTYSSPHRAVAALNRFNADGNLQNKSTLCKQFISNTG